MSQELYLSIVIPAYNEETRIGATLDHVLGFLQGLGRPAEIIVADDGSTDRTLEVVREKLRSFPHQILEAPGNRGKGDAVRRGMLAAGGAYVLFTDADLSTPIEEVLRFIQAHEQGYDIVIGSRALAASKVEVRQNFLREAMGRIFNLLAQLLTFKNIRDSQCGFKSFKRRAAQDLFARQKLDGFSFDVEILFLAQRMNFTILEEPVIWRNSGESRVHILRDPFKMIWELIQIRLMHGL